MVNLNYLKKEAELFQIVHGFYKGIIKFANQEQGVFQERPVRVANNMLMDATVALLLKVVDMLPVDDGLEADGNACCEKLIWKLERYKKCSQHKDALVKSAETWSEDVLKDIKLKGECENDE